MFGVNVTDYDRQKLEEFQATVKEIEDTEAKLKEEETELQRNFNKN